MGLLGKPLGTFSLDESDRYIGSFISKADVERILSVNDDDMMGVPFKELNGNLYIDETTLRKKFWEKGAISHARPSKIGNSTISEEDKRMPMAAENTPEPLLCSMGQKLD